MGEGVTNPVEGAASSSADSDPVSSLVYVHRVATGLELVLLLLSLIGVIALRLTTRRRKERCLSASNSCSPKDNDFTASMDDVSVGDVTDCTGLTGKSEPHLRWSAQSSEKHRAVSPLDDSPPSLHAQADSVADFPLHRPTRFGMDTPGDSPATEDPQPDSFFTWDSGGSSGEYSFVHTAVELPKYPDNAISEEERQMLLLYMQTGHPELLLATPTGNVNVPQQVTDNVMTDPAAMRGFLETIVEENSDDLKSPSECDETSLGWGSWDESDEDRLTVVEMVTSADTGNTSPSVVYTSADYSQANGILSDVKYECDMRLFPVNQQTTSICEPDGKDCFLDRKQIGSQHADECTLRGQEESQMNSMILPSETSVDNMLRNVLVNRNKSDLDDTCMDSKITTPEKCAVLNETKGCGSGRNNMDTSFKPPVSSIPNNLSSNEANFDALWITADALDGPESLNPWTTCEFKNPVEDPTDNLTSIDFTINENSEKIDSSLLVIGLDDLCLVPSTVNITSERYDLEDLMFSDNFKDYFLPSDHFTPGFNKDEILEQSTFVPENGPDILSNVPQQKSMRCFRIGFDSGPTEQVALSHLDSSQIDPNDFCNDSQLDDFSKLEQLIKCDPSNSTDPNELQDTMFSPVDGDIVYGSTWLTSQPVKEPEKTASGAEVHCLTMQTDVRREAAMQSESPPPDNNRRTIPHLDQSASDDEKMEVSNSLSRWQHHTDLQHLQEGTSPLTRWQHQSNFQAVSSDEGDCKRKETDSDGSDDGLPPQLKEIYSSFKMRDNKMGRIRIKEDKNNNFKRLGLWDNESKVTLPPFKPSLIETTSNNPKPVEHNGASREDLDDLEFEMFSTQKNPHAESKSPDITTAKCDSDIDDALRSFNHLDDYSSLSDEASESENHEAINILHLESALAEVATSNNSNAIENQIEDTSKDLTVEVVPSSLENPCSDNSDNCPLCTDPSFKNSRINDLFSLQNSESVEHDVQSLLQKTYPKMKRLSQSNSDPDESELNADSISKPSDSMSPLTTSDSDEGIRAVKEVKKRTKKRVKDSQSTELKHDDSGYVEDDEDDDEDDSLGGKLDKESSPSQLLNADVVRTVRKSLSTAYYESKSRPSESFDTNLPQYPIPGTYKEFTEQLEQSLCDEAEKWKIPENLSQFSAWLLDKELNKINNRDEMEKLLVNDIMKLREQTIADFLKNSSSAEQKIILNSAGLSTSEQILETISELNLETCNEKDKTDSKESSESTDGLVLTCNEHTSNTTPNSVKNIEENEISKEEIKDIYRSSDDDFSSDKTDSDKGALTEEYYSYNINSHVSKIFEDQNRYQINGKHNECGDNESNTTENQPKPDLEMFSVSGHEATPNNVSKSEGAEKEINTIEAEITHESETATPCSEHDTADFEHNGPADFETGVSAVEPATDDCHLPISLELETKQSITYQPRGPAVAGEILLKVNDTTIQKAWIEKQNQEKALLEQVAPELVTPSTEAVVIQNVNNDSSCEGPMQDVAPSADEGASYSENKPRCGLVGVSGDLMTLEVPEEKGAYEASARQEADAITTPEATVVTEELSNSTHVYLDSSHAHNNSTLEVSRSNINTDSFNSRLRDTDTATSESSTDYSGSHSLASESPTDVISCSSDKISGGSEEVDCCTPATVTSVSAHDHSAEFTTDDCVVKPCEGLILNEVVSDSDSLECGSSEVEVGKPDSSLIIPPLENTDIILSSSTTENEVIDKSDNLNFTFQDIAPATNEVSKSVKQLPHAAENVFSPLDWNASSKDTSAVSSTGLNNFPYTDISDKADILTRSKASDSEIPIIRAEYKRSNSLGREPEENFEPLCTQSKSTPDLRRCHQLLNSSVPLSALLSKSVSQRIHDYLGQSSRGGRLNRSLPPNERSRHYRRICVSTETVVERAARFEARSKSSSAGKSNTEDHSVYNHRSGSCPPPNMRSNTSWISDSNYRIYSKPTAAVRPTIDTQRNGSLYKRYGSVPNGKTNGEMPKESQFELITGYTKASKVTHKPPVPPSTIQLQQSLKSTRLKGKIATARKDFFERLSQQDLAKSTQDVAHKEEEDQSFESPGGLLRFDEFRRSAREERARLAASHPDLGALEAAVRSSKRKIDQLKKKKKSGQAPLDAGLPPAHHSSSSGMPSTSSAKDLCLPYRRCTGEIAWASCAKRVQEAKAKSKGSLAQLEIVDVVHEQRAFWFKRPAETGAVRAQPPAAAGEEEDDDYDDDPVSSHSNGGDSAIAGGVVENSDFLGTRARSMDFLLDADNREKVQPPENRLASGQARVKSEHELRIERSLQNLTIPDWYKQSAWSKKPKEGFILRRGSEGSAGESRKRWQGFSSSRTPSATSLSATPTSYSQRNIVVPKRVTPTSNEWRYVGSLVSSRESLTPASPASLSPRECASATFQYGLSSSLSRWSSSRLSTSSAPLTALSVHRSFRQPYLGWRAAAASSGYTPSSGGGSRSSPGVSPINATTPVQGSRPGSPRRGSQEHHFVYGLQQNQITSAATLRPDGSEATDSNRISPLALNTTNVFFNSNVEVSHADEPQRFASAEMRRDRYSYTQSLYSGTVIVSPCATDDDRRNFNIDQMPRIVASLEEEEGNKFRVITSPQPPPRVWMESSFVGTKKDGSDPTQHLTTGRSIRIVPSDSARAAGDRFGSSTTSGSAASLRGTCATQTAMDTRELIDHLHNFLRGLQNRNQMIRPSSTSAFTPVPSSSNSGFHQTASSTHDTDEDDGSHSASISFNRDQRPSLIEYESEPKAYPRGAWRHSSSSSKDISPDNSSTDNELWLSVGEDMGPHRGFRTTPEHPDGRSSSRSSISPPSPPMRYPQAQKRVSEDSTGSARPIFFASSRRGSKGSNPDSKSESSSYIPQQHPSPTILNPSQNISREEMSRKSSSVHSEESGFIRRDSRSGGSNSWRDSKTDQESSSAATSRGEKDSKSSASMEEVLESLLAIPPTNSRSSSPTSPRRSTGPVTTQQQRQVLGARIPQECQSLHEVLHHRNDEQDAEVISRMSQSALARTRFPESMDGQQRGEEEEGSAENDQGKMFADSLSFPQPFPSSSTSTTVTKHLPICSPLEEVNHGSFCRSSSTSPLEDDIQSPTSMEVLVPEGEEQELSSIIEDEAKLTEEYQPQDERYRHHHPEQPREPVHECHQHEPARRPPLQRQATLPSCSSTDPLHQQRSQEDICAANLFAGLQQGSYSRGVAEGSLRRPQSLCLVLLHLPCMFCARALEPPPTINSFSNGPPSRMTCVSEPGTPVREQVCSSYEPGSCCGHPVVLESPHDDPLTNLGSNPGRGPSVTTTTDEHGATQEATPTRKKKPARGVPSIATEGHLKCHRPKCTKSLPVEEARAKFRTCPNCYTYYCSRQCRKLHLTRHKDHCPQTRISNLCKQVLMKARDDPVSRRHLSLCAKRGLLSRGRGAVKLLFLNPEDALDYLVHGWENAKGQTLYVSRADLLPQEMGSDVFSQVRSFCDKYNPDRKFILLAAITVTNEIAAALEREVVVRGAKMHLSPSLPEDDVQTLILTITKTDPETGDPAQTTVEDRKNGLSAVVDQLSARGVDLEKLYPHTYRKILKFVTENEPFTPISIFPTDQRVGRVFMCIILPWADPDIIVNISSKSGASTGKSSKKKWIS